jgi:thiamine-phosphate pyrophosphorylase
MLWLFTNRRLVSEPLPKVCAKAAQGGVTHVVLREKDLRAKDLFNLARAVKLELPPGTKLFIADRLDVALALPADGCHLAAHSLPTAVARKLAGRHLSLSRATHSPIEAAAAARSGADYVVLGTLFESPSHPDREPLGLEGLRETRQAVLSPLIAIGGITSENAADCMNAGADGLAVMRAILEASDAAEAARNLCLAMSVRRARAAKTKIKE